MSGSIEVDADAAAGRRCGDVSVLEVGDEAASAPGQHVGRGVAEGAALAAERAVSVEDIAVQLVGRSRGGPVDPPRLEVAEPDAVGPGLFVRRGEAENPALPAETRPL